MLRILKEITVIASNIAALIALIIAAGNYMSGKLSEATFFAVVACLGLINSKS